MRSALCIEKYHKIFNRHYCVIQLLLTLKAVIFVNCTFFYPAAIAESNLEIALLTGHKPHKKKKISLVYYRTSLMTKNVIFNMLSNSSQQTGCLISLDDANCRNKFAPKDKTFEALEESITWTLKAIPSQSVLESLE